MSDFIPMLYIDAFVLISMLAREILKAIYDPVIFHDV